MRMVSRWSAAALMLVVFASLPMLRAQEKAKEAPATLVVKCVEDATLSIFGKAVKQQSGTERRFVTPPLEAGHRYYYMVSAFWEPNNYTKITRTKKVVVEAGKTTTLDLSKKGEDPDDIIIRYVPTPQTVVDAMLKLAKVGKDDVVFDLGCGDGRIVVTAVGKFGAKQGVGVDIDPKRIKESNDKAKEDGVQAKVEFRIQDVMKIPDLSKATVVCLYLGNELNEQLRPILQKTLKPGSRIVTHRFRMGDWKPEQTETLSVGGETYQIHLWTIQKPADDKKEPDKKDEKDKDVKEKKEKAPKDKDKKEKDEKDKE